MVKSATEKQQQNESEVSFKFKGVRKRKWGKYVSEIRLPNSRQRIWLGSYDTAEKAARAFDAALFCLRGRSAKFNFPDNPPDIVNGRSLTPAEIQVAAARFANSVSGSNSSATGRVENLEPDQSSSLSSTDQLLADSPSQSVSNGAVQLDNEMTNTPFNSDFLDTFSNLTSENIDENNTTTNSVNNFANYYGLFPGFDDFSGDYYVPSYPNVDYGDENYDEFSSQGSFLWNF